MENEFKITEVADVPQIKEQLEGVREEFQKTATSYADMVKMLAGGVKVNPKTIQELTEKSTSYNKSLTDLIKTQNRLSSLQERQVKILASTREHLEKLSSLSKLSRMFDDLSDKITKASKALDAAVSSTDKVASSQKAAEYSAEGYALALQKANDSLLSTNGIYTEITNTIKPLDREVSELNRKFMENKAVISETRKQLTLLDKEYKKGNIDRKEYLDKASALNMKEKELTESNRQLSVLLRDHSKIAVSTAGSYNEMNSSVLQLERRYKSLSATVRESDSGKRLLKQIEQLKGELSSIDGQMGNYQRNVGNYQSHWNGLGMSVQQVAREIPSVAYGWNVFFSAISNNLPILADEIKKARVEFKELSAAGQKATPVWKQLISSVFNWQTLLVAGITILTLYGKEIMEWVGDLFKGKKAVDGLLSSEQQMAIARRNANKGVAKQRVELDLLYHKLKDVSLSERERVAAMNEWVKKFPEYASVIEGENVNLKKLEMAYSSLKDSIIKTAVARKYEEVLAETAVKRDNEEIKRLNIKKRYWEEERKMNAAKLVYEQKQAEYDKGNQPSRVSLLNAQAEYEGAKKNFEDVKKEYEESEALIAKYDADMTSISDHISTLDMFPQPKEGTKQYWENVKRDAVASLDSIDSKLLDLMNNGRFEGIEESIVNTYKSAVKQIEEADKNLSVYEGLHKSNQKAQKEEESHAKYMLRIRNELAKAKASIIDQEREAEIENIKAEYQKRLSLIKGGEKEEEELKTDYKKAMNKKIADINERYDREIEEANLRNKLDAIRADTGIELEERLYLQLRINEILREAEVEAAKKRREDVEAVNEKFDRSFIDIVMSNAAERAGLIENSMDTETAKLKNSLNEELNLERERYQKGLISKEKYERESLEITDKYLREELGKRIKFIEQILSLEGLSAKDREKYATKLAELRTQLAAAGMNAINHQIKEGGEAVSAWWKSLDWKGKASFILENFAEVFEGVAELSSAILDRRIQDIEEEQEANEEAGEKELDRITNLEETGAITKEEAEARKRAAEKRTADKDKELAKQKAELQARQARWDKANSATQTIIRTALGIMSALAMLPPNPVLASTIGVTGAISLATILAQPIPKYAKGTKDHPGGLAIVGDGGRHEAIVTDDGAYVTPSSPALVSIPRHAMVIPDIVNSDTFRRIHSDMDVLTRQANQKGEPVTVNVNNDYTRLERKTDALIAETRGMYKYMKKLANNSEWENISRRL